MPDQPNLFPNKERKPIYQGKNELIKASAAIQISQQISTVERKIWNVLLQHAYPNLPKVDSYQISVRTVLDRLGLDRSNNYQYIKERLDNLVDTTVKWNILGKDSTLEKFGKAALLASYEVDRGIIHYGFGPQLREKLHNPSVFASFELSIQREFSGKYTLPLYENLIDYYFPSLKECRLPKITIDELKELLGVNGYNSTYNFKRSVLNKAIEEIHKKTDLRVSFAFTREGAGRRYTHVEIRGVPKIKIPEHAKDVEQYLKSIDAERRRELIREAASELDPFNKRQWNEKGRQAIGTWQLILEAILKRLRSELPDETDDT